MQKILSIVWYKVLPPVFGGQKGIAGFNNELARVHSLVCLCAGNNEPSEELRYKLIPRLPVSKLQFINPFVWQKIKAIAKKEKPTHIIIEHPYHGIAGLMAKWATGARLIVHSHNIESQRFRLLGKWWWWLLDKYERWAHRRADLSLFKTDADMEWAIEHFRLSPEKCLVIRYGIERPLINPAAAIFTRQRHNIAEEEKILLFAGTLDYAPNAEAVANIYHKLAPELDKKGLKYKIIICGRNRTAGFFQLDSLSHPNIIRAGEVRDIHLYFQAADVFINTVTRGAGVQTKNMDAIANHCPVVCFSSMAEIMPIFLLGTKLFPAGMSNWEEFATTTIKASQIKEETPEHFFTYFVWQRCLQPLFNNLNEYGQSHE